MPVFADCGPYYRWIALEGQDEGLAQLKVRELLRDSIRRDGGDFVGVLGFSQGARMVAGLLADQEEGENEGMPDWKFAVLLCGSYPPSSLSASRKAVGGTPKIVKRDEHGEIHEPGIAETIRVPSVHMRGLQDIHLEKGRRLAGYFSDKMEFEFDQGHHLPGAAGDTTSPKTATADLAAAILKQYVSTAPAETATLELPKPLPSEANASLFAI